MGMTFSNAAVKTGDFEKLRAVCEAINPQSTDKECIFDEFFLWGPTVEGWVMIMAPEDHPANSYSLTVEASRSLGVIGVAGFVSQSSKTAMRFFYKGLPVYSFSNYMGEYKGGGDLVALGKLFGSAGSGETLKKTFEAHKTFADDVYREAVATLGLPKELGNWGHQRIATLIEEEGEEALKEQFAECTPQLFLLKSKSRAA